MPNEVPSASQPTGYYERPASSLASKPYEAQAGDVIEGVVVQGHSNQVTVGDTTMVATVPGAIIVTPEQKIALSRRSGVVELRQRQPELLDRERERKACSSNEPTVIEIFGDKGIGKSTLLAFLAYELFDTGPGKHRDGVAFYGAQELSFDDLLFEVWSLFYESSCDWTVRPSSAQQRLHLRDIAALLLLDDIGLSENEIRALSIAAPLSTIILSTEDQMVFGFGKSVPISGLPFDYMRRLAEIQLQRLGIEDHHVPDDVLNRYWMEHNGNPFLFVRAISRWARNVGSGKLPTIDTETAGKILNAVHALQQPVPADVLEAVVNDAATRDVANELANVGQLKSHSPRYTYPWPQGELATSDADEYQRRALHYIASNTDLRTRIDLHSLAFHLLKWASTHLESRTSAITIAHGLSNAFMALGHLDRWSAALDLARQIGDATKDTETSSWARHDLGAAALCRGELLEARNNLRAALEIRRDSQADVDAIEATTALLREVEVRIGGDAGTGQGSGGVPGAPVSPAGSGHERAVPASMTQELSSEVELEKQEESVEVEWVLA